MKIGLIIFSVALSLVACTNKQEKLKAEIRSLDNVDSLTDNHNIGRFNRLLKEYVETYPDDQENPGMYFRIAQNAYVLNEPLTTIRYLDTFMIRYPEHPKKPDALLLKGFTFENLVQDKDKALACYEEFIVLYPEHPRAAEAQLAIQQINKTPEELVREFEENAAKKGSDTSRRQ